MTQVTGIKLVATLSAFLLLTGGCTFSPSQNSKNSAFGDGQKIPYDSLVSDGAAAVERQGDVVHSPYYAQPDFYDMKSTGSLTILEKFKTIQQTTEWTCGPACALMVLEWYNLHKDILYFFLRTTVL